MRRWLVVGACGFQGSHLVDHLVARGEAVVATDLPGADTRWLDASGVPFIPADITRPETLHPVFEYAGKVDGVFHFAEQVSYSMPVELLRNVHVDGTAHLVEAMLEHGTDRLVVLSSGGVYGRPERIPSDESFPLRPVTRYDETKVEQERLIARLADETALRPTVLRPAAVYGPRSRKRAAVPLFLMALGQLPAIPGRGDVYAALVHVADVAGAARHLMGYPMAVDETYNVSDDTLMTLEDILLTLAPHVDAKLSRVHLPLWGLRLLSWWNERVTRRTGRPPKIEKDALELIVHDSFMSNRKLKDTGYTLRYPDYVVGMVETIAWYKARNWLWRDDDFMRRLGGGRPRGPGGVHPRPPVGLGAGRASAGETGVADHATEGPGVEDGPEGREGP